MKHTRIIVAHYGGPDNLQVLEGEYPNRRPGIAQRFPVTKARQAHVLLGTGCVIGKIVLVCNE